MFAGGIIIAHLVGCVKHQNKKVSYLRCFRHFDNKADAKHGSTPERKGERHLHHRNECRTMHQWKGAETAASAPFCFAV